MTYTKHDLYKGFKFRELTNRYRSKNLVQTIKKVYKDNWQSDNVLCERTECGISQFKLYYLLKMLNVGEAVQVYDDYEIY